MDETAKIEFRARFDADVEKHLDDAKGENLVFLTRATHTLITESVKAFTAGGVSAGAARAATRGARSASMPTNSLHELSSRNIYLCSHVHVRAR